MKVLAIDDNELALKLLTAAIAGACPAAEIFPFRKPSELLLFAKDKPCDIAFLDIRMWGMDGLSLAKELKDVNPKINIIFVTAYSKYASEAFELRPSGYLLKPVTKEAVLLEMENLRHPPEQKGSARLYAQTFGNFEIYSYGIPLKFKYSKTKELLAYLVDRNGATASMPEICAILWEGKQDTENLKAYLRKLVSDLTKTLKAAGAEDVLVKQFNCIAIVPDKIICDSYGFMKGEAKFINIYTGQYMAQYSWSEMTKWSWMGDHRKGKCHGHF